jgi:hypothetical protein
MLYRAIPDSPEDTLANLPANIPIGNGTSLPADPRDFAIASNRWLNHSVYSYGNEEDLSLPGEG